MVEPTLTAASGDLLPDDRTPPLPLLASTLTHTVAYIVCWDTGSERRRDRGRAGPGRRRLTERTSSSVSVPRTSRERRRPQQLFTVRQL